MHPIIKPVYYLMNHLSYSGKFMLLCSVFAIPLAFFAIQLANSYHLETHQAKVIQEGLKYITNTNKLVEQIEMLRDLNVTTSWRSHPDFEARLLESKISTIKQIDQLIKVSDDRNDRFFLQKLKTKISADNMAKGTESRSIDAIYDDDQIIVESVHNWRAKLSYSFMSFSRTNDHILSIINLLNETDHFTRTLGKARAFGSLYLTQAFIDSHGAEVLEKTYQELSQLITLIDSKDTEYQPFFIVYPEAQLTQVKVALISARDQLYEQLIAAAGPTDKPLDYFNNLTQNYQQVYEYNQSLFDLSSKMVKQSYQNTVNQLWAFYLSVLLIGLLLVYLAIGLYFSIAITIRELLRSAANFSKGKYDKPVKMVSHDELAAVAEAMDSMRLNIKEREEKLALMSQTDGLTKLSNRKFFDHALQISLANSRRNMTPLTIVMMDLDFFKKVNDEYGHLAGDDCLIKVAKLMKNQYKRQTDVVARYGGEEFIAILYGQDLEDAKKYTEKLRSAIENTTIVSNEDAFKVTASFGLAGLHPPEDAAADDLIALADALLYQSKDKGRNCISAEYYSEK